VEIKPLVCGPCQADIGEAKTVLMDVNQNTELPEAKAEVIEVRQYAVEYPFCGQKRIDEPPSGFEMERIFGARLEGTVVYYRQQHLSYARMISALHDVHGVEISHGGIDRMTLAPASSAGVPRGGKAALERVGSIQTEIQQSAVVHSDETSSLVDGQNWWQWVFCFSRAVLHVIRFDRSVDVIKAVMAGDEVEQSGFFLAKSHASLVPFCDPCVDPERSSLTTRVPKPDPEQRTTL
jgi:hypothetical protein